MNVDAHWSVVSLANIYIYMSLDVGNWFRSTVREYTCSQSLNMR